MGQKEKKNSCSLVGNHNGVSELCERGTKEIGGKEKIKDKSPSRPNVNFGSSLWLLKIDLKVCLTN